MWAARLWVLILCIAALVSGSDALVVAPRRSPAATHAALRCARRLDDVVALEGMTGNAVDADAALFALALGGAAYFSGYATEGYAPHAL